MDQTEDQLCQTALEQICTYKAYCVLSIYSREVKSVLRCMMYKPVHCTAIFLYIQKDFVRVLVIQHNRLSLALSTLTPSQLDSIQGLVQFMLTKQASRVLVLMAASAFSTHYPTPGVFSIPKKN